MIDVTKSKSSITVKIGFNHIKTEMENFLNKEVSDNDVKNMMEKLFENIQQNQQKEIKQIIKKNI